MQYTNDESSVESLLFISGEPLQFKKISKLIKKNKEEVRGICLKISEEYKKTNSGTRLAFKEDSVQMVTSKENAEIVDDFLKIDIEGNLSRSALETISVIAYRGPVTRSEIEEIRGVNCSFTLRQLSIRGLIERIGNPNDSRSYLYKVSSDFLKHMGLERIEDLPAYDDLRHKELISDKIKENTKPVNGEDSDL